MNIDRYLTTTELLDCQGRVQYTLTLLLEGGIRVQGGARTFVIDPIDGGVEPPGTPVPDQVLHAAAELAGRPIKPARHLHRHGSEERPGRRH